MASVLDGRLLGVQASVHNPATFAGTEAATGDPRGTGVVPGMEVYTDTGVWYRGWGHEGALAGSLSPRGEGTTNQGTPFIREWTEKPSPVFVLAPPLLSTD